jgi:hypothetical protein
LVWIRNSLLQQLNCGAANSTPALRTTIFLQSQLSGNQTSTIQRQQQHQHPE